LELEGEGTLEGTPSSVASEVHHQSPLVRSVPPNAEADNPLLVLQELFRKANLEELQALETVFGDAISSSNVRQEAVSLVSEEIESRQH
jgi:hypothetical protein